MSAASRVPADDLDARRRSRPRCGRRPRRRSRRGGARWSPQARISSAPAASASRRNRRTVATAASAASSGMRPWRLTTSPRRSISFSVTIGSKCPSAWTSATSRWNEFDPRSKAATRTRRRLRHAAHRDPATRVRRRRADHGRSAGQADPASRADAIRRDQGAVAGSRRGPVRGDGPRGPRRRARRSTPLDERARHLIEVLERKWSRFRPGSELSRLNAPRARRWWCRPRPSTRRARRRAWRVTGGRYDPSVAGRRVARRDCARRRSRRARAARGVELDGVVLAVGSRAAGRRALDLGGIGKGYAADLASPTCSHGGATGALVNLGGDLRVAGEPPRPTAGSSTSTIPHQHRVSPRPAGALPRTGRDRHGDPRRPRRPASAQRCRARSRSWPARRGGLRCSPRPRSSPGPTTRARRARRAPRDRPLRPRRRRRARGPGLAAFF